MKIEKVHAEMPDVSNAIRQFLKERDITHMECCLILMQSFNVAMTFLDSNKYSNQFYDEVHKDVPDACGAIAFCMHLSKHIREKIKK